MFVSQSVEGDNFHDNICEGIIFVPMTIVTPSEVLYVLADSI